MAKILRKSSGRKGEKTENKKVVESKTTRFEVPEVDGRLDMVIAFDTTGSMARYIDDVRKQVSELVPRLFDANSDLRIGVVAFGDYCDMVDAETFGKAYQCLPLTDNENGIMRFIRESQDTDGGDGDEFYELVIKKIIEETPWRESSTKAVLLIADAAPHEVGYSYGKIVRNSNIDWETEARKAAEKGIKFDTVSIHGLAWYEMLSKITGGVSVPFRSDDRTADLIEAASLSRGGRRSREIFASKVCCCQASGDVEMSSVYREYAKINKKKRAEDLGVDEEDLPF